MSEFAVSPDEDEDGRSGEAFLVDVDGFAGPLDLLLELARQQKVDLHQISILRLADQYLDFIADSQLASLQLAAEYLVMAAWLAYLKSRLLLPRPADPLEPDPEQLASALAFNLRRLEAMRAAGAKLTALPQLGRDFLLRGRVESTVTPAVTSYAVTLNHLIDGYAGILRRRQAAQPLAIEPAQLATVEEAVNRIREMLGHAPGWESLLRYLPDTIMQRIRNGDLQARSVLAATFVATLQLAKEGVLVFRQNRCYGPIFVKDVRDER